MISIRPVLILIILHVYDMLLWLRTSFYAHRSCRLYEPAPLYRWHFTCTASQLACIWQNAMVTDRFLCPLLMCERAHDCLIWHLACTTSMHMTCCNRRTTSMHMTCCTRRTTSMHMTCCNRRTTSMHMTCCNRRTTSMHMTCCNGRRQVVVPTTPMGGSHVSLPVQAESGTQCMCAYVYTHVCMHECIRTYT